MAPIERQRLVNEFTSRTEPAILISQIEAGGVGLNMQAASVVILAEPQWKSTTEEQAVARCHRMGQIRPVDERMLGILSRKASLFDEYVRRSDLKDASPDAVDISDIDAARDVAGQAELERRIVEAEQTRLGLAPS